MTKGQIFNFFDSHFDLHSSTNGWYRMDNPFESKKGRTMSINIDKNTVKCFRSGYKSNLLKFVEVYTDSDWSQAKELIEEYTEKRYVESGSLKSILRADKIHVKMPDHFYLLDEDVPLQSRALKYLRTRNIDLDFLHERGVGFCNEGDFMGRIIVPFLNPMLQYYVGRSFLGSTLKYLNPNQEQIGVGKSEIFYNELALLNHEVFLGEGVFDALTCGEYGISAQGWSLSSTQVSKIISSDVQDLYIVPDQGFYRKALVLATKFFTYKNVFICNLDHLPEGHDINNIGLENVTFKKVTWGLLRKLAE